MIDNPCPKVEDLILNDSFVEFAFGTNPERNIVWENFILQNPQCLESINTAREIILSIKIREYQELSHIEVEKIIQNVRLSYKNQRKNKGFFHGVLWSKALRYAAVIFVILSLSLATYHLLNIRPEKKSPLADGRTFTYRNNTGKSILLKLSDRSSVILRPMASLKYPLRFSGNNRLVYLSGDAFFEVHKNKLKPFYVMTKSMKVRVLGTSFLISENKTTGSSTVSVSTGRVEVRPNKAPKFHGPKNEVLVLTENEQGILAGNNGILKKTKIKIPLPLSPEATAKSLNFVSAPFSDVIKELERAYNISIDYNKSNLGNCLLTASLIDQSLDERLALICQAVEARYHYENGKVMITGKGCK
jgi:transmembrane sensor